MELINKRMKENNCLGIMIGFDVANIQKKMEKENYFLVF